MFVYGVVCKLLSLTEDAIATSKRLKALSTLNRNKSGSFEQKIRKEGG